jgi:hypothetical protein
MYPATRQTMRECPFCYVRMARFRLTCPHCGVADTHRGFTAQEYKLMEMTKHEYEKYLESKGKEPPMSICDCCGKEKPDAKGCDDPYAKEINDELVPMVLCEECYQDRLYEI